MKKSILVIAAGLSLFASSLVGCSDGASGDAANGEKLFTSKGCGSCHNITAETKIGPGMAGVTAKPKLENGKDMTDENLKSWIKTGGAGKIGLMPANPNLTDVELTDLTAYLKTLK